MQTSQSLKQIMINPIDLPFEKKVELVTAANRIPKGEGLTFIKFVEVPLNQVIKRTGNELTKNKVRSEGLVQETITTFVDRINEGRYLFTYEQPVVIQCHGAGVSKELYELVCGEHRLQAHYLTGRDTIFVAVVEFDTEEDLMIYQSNENDEDDEYVKAPRTENDVILTLANMVEKNIIDIDDDKSINARLIRLNQKTNEFPHLREKLRAKYGIITPVKGYSDKDRKNWVSQYKSEITEFSTRSKITPVNDVAYLNKTFKGGSGPGGVRDIDYDQRCFFDVCTLLQHKDVEKVKVVASINDQTSEKLPKVREYKKTLMMSEMLEKCLRIADDYRAGKYNPVEDCSFLFTPQIDSKDNMEDWA